MKIQIQIPIPIQIQSVCSPELERNLLWKSLLASSPFSGQSIATCIYCYVLLYFYLVLIVLLYFYYILGARHRNLHWSIFLCFCCKIFFNSPSAPEMEISAQLIDHCDHCMGLQQKFTWGSKCLHVVSAKTNTNTKVHLGLEMSPGCTSSATLGREKFRCRP